MIVITEWIATADTVTADPEPMASVSGVKWLDVDGDGQMDAGEPPLEGVTVYIDLDDDGIPDPGEPSTPTVADGSSPSPTSQPASW